MERQRQSNAAEMIDTLTNLIRLEDDMNQPIHDQFLIAVDDAEPLVRLLADMRRDGYEVDLKTDPPTLRRGSAKVIPMRQDGPEAA